MINNPTQCPVCEGAFPPDLMRDKGGQSVCPVCSLYPVPIVTAPPRHPCHPGTMTTCKHFPCEHGCPGYERKP